MRWVALLAVAACGQPPAADPTPDAAQETSVDAANVDASALAWESVETISNDGEVIVERVKYRADGLLISARMCRPADGNKHGLAIYNHGGFSGLGLDPAVANCEESAKFGYVFLASSYRGEDGSEGQIEVCLGEVTDVLRMIEIAVAQPYVNPNHVLMWGGSHGGCITLRALQRGAPVHAAVAIYPPMNIGRVFDFWADRIEANDPQSGFYQSLSTTVRNATGGTPAEQPAAYAARAPELYMADLPASVPLLIAHGTADTIVPVSESCGVAQGFTSFHLDTSQQITTSAPSACAASGVTWSAGPYPQPSWTGSRYFVAYDGLGHDVSGPTYDAMQIDLATFLMAK